MIREGIVLGVFLLENLTVQPTANKGNFFMLFGILYITLPVHFRVKVR
jgi:hypothetical protein